MKITKIIPSSHFRRAMKKIPLELKAEVDERQEIFQKDCFDSRLKTHKLRGNLKECWAFSITYKHRIMFKLHDDGVAEFIDVDDHSIYQ